MDRCMSRILHALYSVRCLGPPYSSRCFHTTKSLSKRPELIRKPETNQNAKQPNNRRTEAGRINALLYTIARYAAHGNSDAVRNYVHGKLDADHFRNPSRSLAYDRIITSLLGHNMVPVALGLYERMFGEGLIPSLFLRVQMEALAIVHSSKSREEVERGLKEVFAEGSYDDTSLGELIATLKEPVYPPEMINSIVKLFVESKGPGYRPSAVLVSQLVDLLVRKNSNETAKEWLGTEKEFDESAVEPPHPSTPSPHITFLTALAETRPDDVSTQLEILSRMQHDGVSPDTEAYNALIAAQIRRNNLSNAFHLYSTLLEYRPTSMEPSPKQSLLPDATTFRLMFIIAKRLRLARGVRSRRFKRPKNAISARQLYRDMIESHLIQTRGRPTNRSHIIKRSPVHLALRTFMLSSDYAAALIVLHSMEIYGIPPDIITYQFVIKGLLRRMHHQLTSARDVHDLRWVDVLLRREHIRGQVVGMTGDWVVHLVQFGLDHRITLDDVPQETLDGADDIIAQMPSLALIMGEETPTKNKTYSIIPLKRILRRALLAQLALSPNPSFAGSSPAQQISGVIAHTKEVMVPELPSWVKKAEAPDMRSWIRKTARSVISPR